MKNIAIIFAGGSGKRMNTATRPKQFLELNGKPVIIYTIELFDLHTQIDGIVCVCIESWISYLEEKLKKFEINKVGAIVPGGETGQDSIYNGLVAAHKLYGEDCNVLIHDGVRPLINAELITKNIKAVRKHGNAITTEAVRESVIRSIDGENISEVPPRSEMYVAKAPQSFYFKDIVALYDKSDEDDFKSIDASHLCSFYSVPMHIVKSTKNNLKITEPADYYIYRALYEALESQQIFGV